MTFSFLLRMLFCALMLGAATSQAALTDTERDVLLAQHNQSRSSATPSAANMTRLAWDPNLETVAQNWAAQCNFSHNANRNNAYAGLSSNTGSVGENLYITTSSRASALTSASGATALWAAEVADYSFATNSCAAGKVCGHYTQMVWANTRRIGCAVQFCPTVIGLPTFTNAQLVVCDYNPAGNFIGQAPYLAGTSGSLCPADLPNVLNGLCSPASAAGTTVKQVPTLPGSTLIVLAVLLAVRGLHGRRPRQPFAPGRRQTT